LKKISITDIAKELNVSKTLVSLVLNNKAKENRISEEIEQKVRDTAKRMNYRPNPFAKSLRSGKSQTLGLIVSDISSNFFSNLSKSVEKEAAKYNYNLIIGSTGEDIKKQEEIIQLYKDRFLDGLIISPAFGSEDQILQLRKENFPFVLIDRNFSKIKTNSIVVDNYNASFKAVQHLLNNGYKNIGVLSTLSMMYSLKLRVEGYKDAIRQSGLRLKNKLIKNIDFFNMRQGVETELKDLLSGPSPIDALYFANCDLATIGLEVIYKMGIKVPEDLAIISFDDPQSFRYSFSPITAISQPINEMGTKAVQLLMNQLENKESVSQQITINTTLNIRESSIKST
jgi:LacI family transcriptional regulator